MQISNELNDILSAAYQDAKIHKHEYLTPEHLFYSILSFPYGKGVFRMFGAGVDDYKETLRNYLETEVPKGRGEPKQTVGFQHVMERTFARAAHAEKETVESGDLLVSLFESPDSYCTQILEGNGLRRVDILEVVSHVVGRSEEEMNAKGFIFISVDDDEEEQEIEEAEEDFDEEEPLDDEEEVHAEPDTPQEPRRRGKGPILSRYAVNLVERAKAGNLEPLIGRQDILERTMQVLCRRLKNNPVHVGPPGVGKTAITEGLAQLIAGDQIPDLLKGYELWALDLGAIVAGTRYRGDFEERIKQILKSIERKDKLILFIDELHMLVGTGAANGGAMDASNLLKPALASGKIRVIGATTREEYRRFIEKDHALARRFQAIDIEEPSLDEAVEILKGLRPKYEDFHKVQYSDEAIEAAVNLSSQFINERYLPDKAIDVIDEAGALVNLRNFKLEAEDSAASGDPDPGQDKEPEKTAKSLKSEAGKAKKEGRPEDADATMTDATMTDATTAEPTKADATTAEPTKADATEAGAAPLRGRKEDRTSWQEIGPEIIEGIVSKIAKIPQKTVTVSERDQLKTLEERLLARVFGQDEAVQGVVESVKRARAGFRKGTKPVASFLFVGPTGVGKTELAKSLSAELGVELIRFDMSEYQERHTVSRLIGSPPGYVGYEEGGLLTEAIRKSPHAVLLLDEIEKAHPDIYNILLQVMDYATLTDNSGRKADFRNVILIMTSNAGAREIGKPLIGFGNRLLDEGVVDDAVKRAFSPEFRNRLNRVVQFRHLGREILLRVVKKEIREFSDQLQEQEVLLDIDEAVYEVLADKTNSHDYGAREIERLVDDHVRSLFIDELLYGKFQKGGKAKLLVKDGVIQMEGLPSE